MLASTLLSDHCNKLLQIITSYTETGLALFYVAVEKAVKWKDKFSLSQPLHAVHMSCFYGMAFTSLGMGQLFPHNCLYQILNYRCI